MSCLAQGRDMGLPLRELHKGNSMKYAVIAAMMFAAPAWADERDASVVQFNGHSVTIQARGLLGYVPDEIEALALRMCTSAGKNAEHQSSFNVSADVVSYFFVCI